MTKQDVKQFADKLKQQAKENPLAAVMIGAAAVTALSKLIDSNTQRTYAKAHAKEIDRRIAKSYSR